MKNLAEDWGYENLPRISAVVPDDVKDENDSHERTNIWDD